MKKHRAVFLDRDGTINREVSYLKDPGRFELLPGAAHAIRLFNGQKMRVVVVTNQSGIARGFLTEEDLGRVHEKMRALLALENAAVDAVYYCPHHPTGGTGGYRIDCGCRKPKSGMLTAAANDLGIDLARSFVISDKLDDLQMGEDIPCRMVLVRTGYGEESVRRIPTARRKPDAVVRDLLEAAETIARWTLPE